MAAETMYLWTHFLTNKWVKEHTNPVVGCPSCGPFHVVAHWWPEYFECVCGTVVILDRWLADGIERTAMMTYEELDKFFKTHEKVFDLCSYPLEQRLKNLRGYGETKSAPEGWTDEA